MNESKQYILQGLWLVIAAGIFAAAGLLQPVLERKGLETGMLPDPHVVGAKTPRAQVLAMLPGCFRTPIVAGLWIRAEELKNEGKYFDALQLAELICDIQPEFTGAWVFQGWNMAYNISVGTHTLEQRWHWVYSGIKLLRDRGIPANPQAINIYRELAWTFFFKIGGFMDDYHMGYKRTWAAYMQRLLAPPAYACDPNYLLDSNVPLDTRIAIEAFRPIAEAPLDRDLLRQGKEPYIQPEKLAQVLADPACAEYARKLREANVPIDRGLLDAYNKYSRDECIQAIRPVFGPPVPPGDRPVADLINAPEYAAARGKLLAFVRAQLLWNQYRMDPKWMLGLMERYGPLDWRLPWPHSLYWASYGFHAAEGTPMESLDRVETLNDARNMVFSLASLTWQGRVTYLDNPANPDQPFLGMFPDPRFIEPAQREYMRLIAKATADRQDAPEDSPFRAGHINYLAAVVDMLFILYRNEEAAKYLKIARDMYHLKGGEWDAKDVEEFAFRHLNTDATPNRDTAVSHVSSAVQMGWLRALVGDRAGKRKMHAYAERVYTSYNNNTPERNHLPPLNDIVADVTADLLVQPWMSGYNLSLQSRSQLYRMLPDGLQARLYPAISPFLRAQCQDGGIDFDRAFPPPPKQPGL